MDDGLLDALTRAIREDLRGADPTTTPARIGRYAIERELGRGGCGIVYLARDGELDRQVALKVMTAHPGVSSEEIERFHREARLAARLRHPGIVAVHDVGRSGDLYFIAMDHVPGGTLADRIRDGRRPLPEKVRILEKAARAVAHAHADGIVHRDLKPANILVDAAGEPHVTDFGLARSADPGGTITTTGTVMGTPAYMSPEQVRGQNASLDARTDVYSMGVMLYEAMTGRLPFEAAGVVELFDRILTAEPVPPSKRRRGLHRDLEQVCLKALDKDPRRRYRSALELADDLARWLAGEPVLGRPVSVVTRIVRRLSRHRLTVAAAAIGVAGIVAAIAWPRAAGDPAREAKVRELAALGQRIQERHQEIRSGRLLPERGRDDLREAERRVSGYLKAHPGDPAGTYLLARVLMHLGRLAEAERHLAVAVSVRADFRPGWTLLGIVRIERALSDSPSLWQERRSRLEVLEAGRADLSRGCPPDEQGREEAAKWGLTWTRYDQIQARLAWALDPWVARKDMAESRRRLEESFREFRGEEFAYWFGQMHEDDDRRLKLVREALSLAPGFELAWLTAGNIHFDRGDLETALADYENVIRLRPEWPLGYLSRGNVHARGRRFESALRDYARVLLTWPQDATTLHSRAIVLDAQGRLEDARRDLEEACRLTDGRWAPALYLRARIRERQGDAAGAETDADRTLELDPGHAKAALLRGNLRDRRGELARAIEDYRLATESDPRLGEAWYFLGFSKFRGRDYAGARPDLDRAVELRGGARDFMVRGLVRLHLEEARGAVADFDRALELEPHAVEGHFNRAQARRAAGDSAGALADLEEVLRLAPSDSPLRAHAARWRGELSNPR